MTDSDKILPTDSEFYNFENKKASREEIRDYIIRTHKRFSMKPFDELTILILSHIEGRDLIEIYYPLGVKPENVIVVEYNKETAQNMRESVVFKGCEIVCMDVKKYMPTRQIDIYHLDFTSNIHKSLISDVVLRLIAFNQLIFQNIQKPIIFYYNFFAGRERKDTTERFNNMKQDAKRKSKVNEKVLKSLANNETKISLKCNEFHKFFEHFDRFKTAFSENIKINKCFEKSNDNAHIFRADYLLDVLSHYFTWFNRRLLPKMKKADESKIDDVDYYDKYTTYLRHEFNTATFLAYAMNSIDIFDYYPFKYISRNGTPFISILFTIDSISNLIKQEGFRKEYYEYELNKENDNLSMTLKSQLRLDDRDLNNIVKNVYKIYEKEENYNNIMFRDNNHFIYLNHCIIGMYALTLYNKREIKFKEMNARYSEFIKKTFEMRNIYNSTYSTMLNDAFIMGSKILKNLKRKEIIRFGMHKGKRIALLDFNPFGKYIVKLDKIDKKQLANSYSFFVVGMDLMAKVYGMMTSKVAVFSLKELPDNNNYDEIKKDETNDDNLRITNGTDEMKKQKRDLSIDDEQKRAKLVYSYIDTYIYDHKSSEIAYMLNKDLYSECNKYPIPLFWDLEIRGYLASMKNKGIFHLKLKALDKSLIENNKQLENKAFKLLENTCYHCKREITEGCIKYNKELTDIKVKINIFEDIDLLCEDCS